MLQMLTYTQDKFTFTVPTDRFYTVDGVWAKADGDLITVGVSDFFQQHNGDVAFADVAEVGTMISSGDEFANIETIKIDVELPSPVTGKITAVNEVLEMEAERINEDPYGAGWLAVFEAGDWPGSVELLLTPEQYLEHMKVQAQEETR